MNDPDHAQGIVYSKNEHEAGAEWIIMQMYSDGPLAARPGELRPAQLCIGSDAAIRTELHARAYR